MSPFSTDRLKSTLLLIRSVFWSSPSIIFHLLWKQMFFVWHLCHHILLFPFLLLVQKRVKNMNPEEYIKGIKQVWQPFWIALWILETWRRPHTVGLEYSLSHSFNFSSEVIPAGPTGLSRSWTSVLMHPRIKLKQLVTSGSCSLYLGLLVPLPSHTTLPYSYADTLC